MLTSRLQLRGSVSREGSPLLVPVVSCCRGGVPIETRLPEESRVDLRGRWGRAEGLPAAAAAQGRMLCCLAPCPSPGEPVGCLRTQSGRLRPRLQGRVGWWWALFLWTKQMGGRHQSWRENLLDAFLLHPAAGPKPVEKAHGARAPRPGEQTLGAGQPAHKGHPCAEMEDDRQCLTVTQTLR